MKFTEISNTKLTESFKIKNSNTPVEERINENISALQSELEQKYNLKSLFLADMGKRNAIELHSIIVNKEEQGSGTGSKVMQEIIAYADANGKIVVLDPGLLDKQHGTTSQSRLRKFYKRFGFIDNKGRNKNYEFRNLMIRYPQSNESLNEGYKLQLERDTDMMVLHITDTDTGKRTEVRGKSGYETNGYDKNDKLHQLLDKISKTANISELMNGEVVGINPKHPDGASAKKATTKAFNESVSGEEMLKMFHNMHHDAGMNPDMDEWVKSQEWGIDTVDPKDIVDFEELFDYDDPFDRIIDVDEGHVKTYMSAIKSGRKLDPVILGPKHSDGKYSIVDGNHRALAYAALNMPIPAYMPMGQIDETTVTEALDNPYPFELIGPNDSQEFSALAQTPNGMLRMDFEATDYDNFGIDFSVGKSMGKTEAGDEFKVFATVVAMMTKWIKTVGIEHVESFDFGANKGEHASDGRAKLYTRFAKQLASKLGWKLEQSTTANNSTAFFKLTNPNPTPREQEYWDALEENFADGKKIRDSWFKDGFKTYKVPAKEKYVIADKDGTVQTLEGPVSYKKGYYIMTGPKGEKYPIPPEKFKELKDDHGNGIASPKKIIKIAKLADHDGAINTSWGATLQYNKGKDYIVRHGPNDYGVVKSDIFKQTYKQNAVEETVNEATEMKISDLTISDAGMAIAQSVGGGSRTDAPLAVTKLPSGHVYLVNGYHRLVDAMNSGKDTVSVEYVPYERVAILWKQEREQDIKYGKQFSEGVVEAEDTLTLPKIKVGDEVMVGKFKNRKAEVKGFSKDEHNQPVLNTTKGDQKLFKLRLAKLMKDK